MCCSPLDIPIGMYLDTTGMSLVLRFTPVVVWVEGASPRMSLYSSLPSSKTSSFCLSGGDCMMLPHGFCAVFDCLYYI